jgi:two-component system chemotaxis response regulator CheY
MSKTCLIVDDSSTIRRVMANMFRKLDFTVAEATTGAEAVERCRVEVPDLVMLDWNMPEMDGITCLRILREMVFAKPPVIVMCTSESDISKIQQTLAAGADEYIMKPFDQDVLLDKLVDLKLAVAV